MSFYNIYVFDKIRKLPFNIPNFNALSEEFPGQGNQKSSNQPW